MAAPKFVIDWDLVKSLKDKKLRASKIALYLGISTHLLYLRCQTDKGFRYPEL
jgi:hypothetical protein